MIYGTQCLWNHNNVIVPILSQGANTCNSLWKSLKKDVNQSYYNVLGVIEEYTFCIHSAIYEELPSKEDKIGIAGTLETVHDDVEFYKTFDHSFEGPKIHILSTYNIHWHGPTGFALEVTK